MKKIVLVLVVAAALVAAARTRSPESAASTLERATVERRDLSTFVKATGVVRPTIGAEVRVGSRVSGVVKRLHVKLGDTVAKGQLLAELDSDELEARRAQAEAALETARANEAFARADRTRRRELATADLVSASDLDLADRSEAVASAQVAEARANLAYARTQLAFARIHAPIAGIVAAVSTQEGETVAASFAAPTFVTLVDLGRLEVWTYVDETDVGRVQVGQPARFTVDTYPDDPLDGTVNAIYPSAEIRDNVVNYVAVVAFAPPPGRILRPQMTATVRIALERREATLVVPRRAVRREGGRTFVLCARGDEVARREVTTGTKDESWFEIKAGVAEGEVVLVGEKEGS